MKRNSRTLWLLLLLSLTIMIVPLWMQKGAEFGGSDDAGSQMIAEIQGSFEPWFTPVLETALQGELPGEIESLLFCVQTGIGVGIIAFWMGRFVERKKYENSHPSC
ncbi:MAG: cobalt transport protein CbiN [Lachnospiraceae bacterium]